MMAKSKRKGRVGSIITVTVIVAMMLAVSYLLLSSLRGNVPYIFGNAVVQIKTGSMEPEIPTGSFILVHQIDPEDVKVGDVIIFYSDDPSIAGKANTHRVVEIITDASGKLEFVTKGDNNDSKDIYNAKASKVTGIYVRRLQTFTKIAAFLKKPWAFLLCIIIPSVFLLVLCIFDLFKKSKDLRMETLVQEELERLKKSGELDALKKKMAPKKVDVPATPDEPEPNKKNDSAASDDKPE